MEKADGVLLFTPASYEPEAVAAAKSWFGETGRHAYAVGPLLPAASKATAQAHEKKLSAESAEIITFLDETLKTSGEKSLVYVSAFILVSMYMRNLTDFYRYRLVLSSGPLGRRRSYGRSSTS